MGRSQKETKVIQHQMTESRTPTVGEIVSAVKTACDNTWRLCYTNLQLKVHRLNAWRFWLAIGLGLATAAAIIGWSVARRLANQ